LHDFCPANNIITGIAMSVQSGETSENRAVSTTPTSESCTPCGLRRPACCGEFAVQILWRDLNDKKVCLLGQAPNISMMYRPFAALFPDASGVDHQLPASDAPGLPRVPRRQRCNE
jgi:hypothetical protein